MKTYSLTILGWLLTTVALACPICDKRQPKGFAGITHGTGPEGAFDYWMLYGSIAVVVLTLLLFVRFMIRPETRAMYRLKQQHFIDWHHE
ncbi:MAG: hypothetical protein H7Z72_26900 [Bacteroidetes bacterium]|nr:hypothetical protein [Fibrella sp.]